MRSRFIYAVSPTRILFLFHGRIVFHRMCILYSFSCWWTFGLSPPSVCWWTFGSSPPSVCWWTFGSSPASVCWWTFGSSPASVCWWTFGLSPASVCWWTFGSSPASVCCEWHSVNAGLHVDCLSPCFQLELLAHAVILCLTFRGTFNLFFTAAAPSYIPTSDTRLPQYPCILANSCYFLGFFFWWSSSWMWIGISLGFWFAFR